MRKTQITPWGLIVPRFERISDEPVAFIYAIGGRRAYYAEKRGDSYILLLNGREKSFHDRVSMTRWVKTHLV